MPESPSPWPRSRYAFRPYFTRPGFFVVYSVTDDVATTGPLSQELSFSRPLPNPHQRSHAHSISLGAVNANHRVTRRKSVTTAAANAAAAVAASMKEGGESASLPMAAHRRSLGGRKGLESGSVGSPSGYGSYFSRSMNSPNQEPPVARKPSPTNPEGTDGKAIPKGRNRRASEGAQMKNEAKRAAAELRCDRCGKGYKHGSCLSKHMCVSPVPFGHLLLLNWEHAPCRLCAGRPRGLPISLSILFPRSLPHFQ